MSTLSAAQPQARAARASLVVIRSDGAQACPDAAALAERVRAVAGSEVIAVGLSAAAIETWVQVEISRSLQGFSAQIRSSGRRHGTRSLEDFGPACESLADAVAVTIAMFLDPYDSPPSQAAEAALLGPLRASEAQAPTVSPETQPRFFLDGSAGVALALLEHGEPFLSLAFGFRPSARWSLALGGTFLLPDRQIAGTRSVDLQLSFAFLQGCVRALGDLERASLAWCAAPQLGTLAGTGRGYQRNFARRAPWVALGIGPEAAFRLSSSLSWVLWGQAVIPLLEQGFEAESDGLRQPAFRTRSVAGLLALGLRGHL